MQVRKVFSETTVSLFLKLNAPLCLMKKCLKFYLLNAVFIIFTQIDNRSSMIFSYRNLVFIFSVILFSACSESEFVYKAQPVDIKVSEKNGTFEVEGSSVFQLPDTFVWGGSPIQIDEKYYLFFSAWESGPDVPPFSQIWVLNSKIGVAVSDLPYGNFQSLGIFLKENNLS